jgi:hypothetical protein
MRRLLSVVLLLAMVGCGGSPPPPLKIVTTKLIHGTVGYQYEDSLEASGGKPPYKWCVKGLPPGLKMNDKTGEITGTPEPETGGVDGKTWDITVLVVDGPNPICPNDFQ